MAIGDGKPDDGGSVDTEALTAPLGDLIAAVGLGVAEAQQALDAQTIASLRSLSAPDDPVASALVQVGYGPKWYTIPEVEAEIVVSLSVTESTTGQGVVGGRVPMSLSVTPVDASYVNKYNYNLQAVSTLRFKIKPVPASEAAENLRAVPDLVRDGEDAYSFDRASEVLVRLGLRSAAADGSARPVGVVSAQEPAAGELVPPNTEVVLTVTPETI